MWIQGRRRGGGKDLSAHLQKTDENESVAVRELEGFSFEGLTGKNLEKAIRQMEAVGYGKGDKRNLYHAIVAPAYGEALTATQRKQMVDYYAEQMGFKGHQYAVVEHWKNGKQHFHLVFNIINPVTGKTHELKWTKRKEWQISRDLERMFGHATPTPKGKAARTKETQRGKRTGTDPRKMRKEVTAIFHASKTAQEFIAALDKAGYALTLGRRNQLVLVDKFGDTHGLMRRIEGKTLADLRQKFPDIEKLALPSHAALVKARQPVRAGKPHMRSRPAAAPAILRRGTMGKPSFGNAPARGGHGFMPVGKPFAPVSHGYKTSGASHQPIQAAFIKAARTVTVQSPRQAQRNFAPARPQQAGGWPREAVIDWKDWGHENPPKFFAKWPELKS